MPVKSMKTVMKAMKKKSNSMKRPAAPSAKGGKGSIAATVKELKDGMTEDKEDKDDEETADDLKRDKGKAEKFKAMRQQLPAHIVHLYDEAANSKASPRSFRTKLINELFDRQSNGRYTLRDDKPLFVEHKALYEKKFNKDSHVAYPKSVMCGLYFHNSGFATLGLKTL